MKQTKEYLGRLFSSDETCEWGLATLIPAPAYASRGFEASRDFSTAL
jgi:hypothetical protein